MPDISVNVPGLEMENPLMLASGIQGGTAASLHRVSASQSGGLVSKSIGPKPRAMYPGPVCVEALDSVILNAMGLPNPGVEAFSEIISNEDFSKPILVSVFGSNADEYADVATKLVSAGAKSIELNLSCPHSKPGSRALIIGQQPELIYDVVSTVRDAVDVPLYSKLSPNTTNIVSEARAALEAGSDGLSLINTVSAIEVDPFAGRPIIGNLLCGMSGPAIRPIAQRKIAEVSLAMRREEIPTAPLLGMGGICTGLDVARFLMLGASAVQIGSALVWGDVGQFGKIVNELTEFMVLNDYSDISSMQGIALDSLEGLS